MKSAPVTTIPPMRLLLAASVLLGAGTARADEAAHCAVDVARAPADVRATIETWVGTETHCAHTIEVRVVPTEGGLYLYARDEHGVVRERVVPDAQAAGVLVASWVADDSPAVPVRVMPIIVPPQEAPLETVSRTAPIATPGFHRGLLFGLGAQASMAKGVALRGEIGIESDGWSAYAAASVGQTRMVYDYGSGTLDLMPHDKRVALGAGRQFGTGRWQVKVRGGVQYARWDADFFSMSDTYNGFHVEFIGFEGAFQVSRKLSPAWSFTSGLVGSKFVDSQQSSNDGVILIQSPTFELGLSAGLDLKL